jgi:hypothetical protein
MSPSDDEGQDIVTPSMRIQVPSYARNEPASQSPSILIAPVVISGGLVHTVNTRLIMLSIYNGIDWMTGIQLIHNVFIYSALEIAKLESTDTVNEPQQKPKVAMLQHFSFNIVKLPCFKFRLKITTFAVRIY